MKDTSYRRRWMVLPCGSDRCLITCPGLAHELRDKLWDGVPCTVATGQAKWARAEVRAGRALPDYGSRFQPFQQSFDIKGKGKARHRCGSRGEARPLALASSIPRREHRKEGSLPCGLAKQEYADYDYKIRMLQKGMSLEEIENRRRLDYLLQKPHRGYEIVLPEDRKKYIGITSRELPVRMLKSGGHMLVVSKIGEALRRHNACPVIDLVQEPDFVAQVSATHTCWVMSTKKHFPDRDSAQDWEIWVTNEGAPPGWEILSKVARVF